MVWFAAFLGALVGFVAGMAVNGVLMVAGSDLIVPRWFLLLLAMAGGLIARWVMLRGTRGRGTPAG